MTTVAEAVRAVRARTPLVPEVAVILGTGLGGGALADGLHAEAQIPYTDIPGFPLSTVETHAGRLVVGTLAGRRVAMMQGRFHRYEGYTLQQIGFPVRVLKALGARTLVVSNISGGMHPLWATGDVVLIADHINLLGDNPLVGPNDDAEGPRFPDMSAAYDPALRALARQTALELKIPLREGVYVAVAGPNLETRAEYRMLRGLGADVVGMSTVPEVIAAAHMGVPVAGISCITNLAAGISQHPLTHQEVVEVAREAEGKFIDLLRAFVPRAFAAVPARGALR